MEINTDAKLRSVRRGYEIGEQLFKQGCSEHWIDYYRLIYLSSEPLFHTDLQTHLITGFNAGYLGKPLPHFAEDAGEARSEALAAKDKAGPSPS